jgi:hypothetical protein
MEAHLLSLLFDELSLARIITLPLLATIKASCWIHIPVVAGRGYVFKGRLPIIINLESQATNCSDILIEIICENEDTLRQFVQLSCRDRDHRSALSAHEYLVFGTVIFHDHKPDCGPQFNTQDGFSHKGKNSLCVSNAPSLSDSLLHCNKIAELLVQCSIWVVMSNAVLGMELLD